MIHLIIGNTGAGKTTYSNKLKEEKKALVFSIDKWNKTLFLKDKTENDGLDWFLERIERSESLIMDYIKQLEYINIDAVLDLGFSKFEHREKFRQFAKANKFEIKIHYLNISKEVRYKRVQKRNKEKGAAFAFEVSKSDFNFMENWFEIPTTTELINEIIIQD